MTELVTVEIDGGVAGTDRIEIKADFSGGVIAVAGNRTLTCERVSRSDGLR